MSPAIQDGARTLWPRGGSGLSWQKPSFSDVTTAVMGVLELEPCQSSYRCQRPDLRSSFSPTDGDSSRSMLEIVANE
ncbi:hypothetical protein ZHAS_00019109 [Anopheles sinensis]|uniref:Uncharacterized protein n=1 Tax=Anopheles sinensis TaxID=74873 RepID=A0A084WLG2_ANOSI|nr:hypothetical protein ZHAS_00019109 [Anopheles sinensis]